MIDTISQVWQEIDRRAVTSPLINWIGIPFSLAAVVFALVSTSHGGIGIGSDPIHYIAASKSLLAGDGYLRYFGTPFVSWPPLYPTVLAGINIVSRWMGIDVVEGIRFIHALLFGLIVFASGKLIFRCIHSKVFALLALTAVVCSFPLLGVTVMALSEPLYILLSLLFVLYLPIFLREQRMHQLALLMLLAMLASMQRYAGIGLTVAGMVCIVVLMRSMPLTK